jgi:DNA-binding response OmpR family regulator
MPNPKPHVLIVDDDQTLAELLKMMLELSGFEPEAVFSGQDALDWLGQRRPDVMVLDLMMPDIDGLAVLRRVRANAAIQNLPIIILTARTDAPTHKACHEAGATALLTKPVSREVLVEQLQKAVAHS